jgi:hypothetical protein
MTQGTTHIGNGSIRMPLLDSRREVMTIDVHPDQRSMDVRWVPDIMGQDRRRAGIESLNSHDLAGSIVTRPALEGSLPRKLPVSRVIDFRMQRHSGCPPSWRAHQAHRDGNQADGA